MGQRRRSRARCDPDLDDNDSPSRRRAPLSEDEEGNEAGHPGVVADSDGEVGKDALVELGDADPRRKDKKRKKNRRKEKRKKQRKADREALAAAQEEEPQVAGTQEGEIRIAESVLTEDGADLPVPDNRVPRNHLRELFVSKSERKVCDSFEAFLLKHLRGSARTLEVEVPGSKTNETYLVAALICRLCTKELARTFVTIIQAGWSLSGDLGSKDLFVTPLGCVRISLEKMEDLVPADADNTKKFAGAVALIVRNFIFGHAPLAFDIASFVNVLEGFSGNCKTLIDHPGLKQEVAKLCQFKVLCMRLVQIFQLDKAKHTRIMEKLSSYCQVNRQNWKLKMKTNIYFERVLKDVEAVEDVKALFQMLLDVISADGLALSRNVQNSQLPGFLYHLMQPASAGRKQRKKPGTISTEPATIRFNYAQIEHMIGCALPNFFCQFYLAMADEDEIDSLTETALSELCLGGSM